MKQQLADLNKVFNGHVKQLTRNHVIQAINQTHAFLFNFPIQLINLEAHLRIIRGAAEDQVFKDVIDFNLKLLRAMLVNYHRLLAENEEKIHELNQKLSKLTGGEVELPTKEVV